MEAGVFGTFKTYFAEDERWMSRNPSLSYSAWLMVTSIVFLGFLTIELIALARTLLYWLARKTRE
jgi:hypothetical protein